MSDTQHEVEVKFTATDLTSKVIGNITKAASGLSSKVDAITTKVTGFARTFGGFGAIFSFGASVASAKHYLATIEDLSTVTGLSANKMASMQHAMEQSGLAGEETRMIMIGLAKKQSEIAAGSQEMAKLAKRYGVELKKGPEAALLSMAKQVEAGKMGTGEVVKLLEESGSKAMDLLRKGPVEVQRLLNEGATKNAHINTTSIAQYKQMDVQMTRVKQAWNRVTTTIMIKLAPALTKIMRYVETNIDSWTDAAGRFGTFLVRHMDSAISAARTFGKIMLANYILMKTTGDGMLGNAGKMLKMAKGKGKFFGGGAKENIMGMALKGGGKNKALVGVANIMSKIPKVGPILTKFFFGAMQLGNIAKFLLKLTGIGILVGGIVHGIKLALKNVDGIRQKITKLLGGIWDDISRIGGELGKMFGGDSPIGMFLQFVGENLLKVVTWILSGVKELTSATLIFARVVANFIKNPTQGLSWDLAKGQIVAEKKGELGAHLVKASKAADQLAKYVGKTTLAQVEMFNMIKEEAAKGGLSEERIAAMIKRRGLEKFASLPDSPTDRPKVYQDFRGSRFDIMQNFAEGFDPDRIAVAFSNDLSSLGERRLQSGLAPAFSAR